MEFSRACNEQTLTNYIYVSSILTLLGMCAFGKAVMGTAKEKPVLNKNVKAFVMVV